MLSVRSATGNNREKFRLGIQYHALAQAVTRRSLNAEAWFRSQVNPCGM
jgi:hypothetical protein